MAYYQRLEFMSLVATTGPFEEAVAAKTRHLVLHFERLGDGVKDSVDKSRSLGG